MWKQKLEAVKFLWKRKHFEERSWKRKKTFVEAEALIFYCFHISGLKATIRSLLEPVTLLGIVIPGTETSWVSLLRGVQKGIQFV